MATDARWEERWKQERRMSTSTRTKRIECGLQPPRRHQKSRESLAPDAVIDSATRASRLSVGATAESELSIDHRDAALCRYEVLSSHRPV